MATNSSRSESPAEIDFSVIRTAIQMNHKMIDQILHGIHYGSEEVRSLLREECDFILECKVCRNLFRSFPNFVAHKRVYCLESFEEKIASEEIVTDISNTETVVVQPEAPEDVSKATNSTGKGITDRVIDRTFEGKSKEYQFYTKVAENVEKRKMTKVINTVSLTSIPSNPNAVIVEHCEGDNSEAILKAFNEKQALERAKKAPKKKSTLADVCKELERKGQATQSSLQSSNKSPQVAKRLQTRNRKSSPRKSIDYVTDRSAEKVTGKKSKGCKSENFDEEDVDEWNEEMKEAEDSVNDQEWLKFCDTDKLTCKVCNKNFNTVQSLKFHAKMKHTGHTIRYQCPVCSSSYEYFKTLKRHLKNSHKFSVTDVNKVQLNIRKSEIKSPTKMETDQKDTTKEKSSGKLLSYSTGWKKCDKCGKVFWKAKSYSRHYSSCKGTVDSSPSKQHSPKKTDDGRSAQTQRSVETIVVGPEGKILMRSQSKVRELIKLQEKLRAKALTPTKSTAESQIPTGSLGSANGSDKIKSGVVKTLLQKKDGNTDVKASPELYKALTGPLNKLENVKEKEPQPKALIKSTSSNEQSSKARSTESSVGTKYSLRQPKSGKETDKDVDDDPPVQETEALESIEVNAKNPNEFKKLEERLSREAGIKDIETRTEGKTGKMYSLRHTQQTGSENLAKESKTGSEEERQEKSMTSPYKKSGTPEIQELQQKLAREALGQTTSSVDNKNHKAGSEEKVTSKAITLPEKTLPANPDSNVEEKLNIMSQVEAVRSLRHHSHENVCGDEVKRPRHVSESARDTGKRHFRSVSQGGETVGKLGERTPEKGISGSIASPVVARRQSFPTSPTSSLHSNSGDGYNFRFKMTVKEMAELVESASLTKFAKERKKKAKTFLTKKQVKDCLRVAPVLSRPVKKRRLKKRLAVVRNIYGTRHSGATQVEAKEDDPNSEDGKSKRLTNEQKRLQNSAGFVEEKFYASKMGLKDSRKENKDQKEDGNKKNSSKATSVPDTSTESSQRERITVVAKVRNSSSESRRSREIKRLSNSAGFVEDKYYTSSSRDSSRDRFSESGQEKTKLPLEIKKLQSSEGFVDKTKILRNVKMETSRDTDSDTDSSRKSKIKTRLVSSPGVEPSSETHEKFKPSARSKERVKLKNPGETQPSFAGVDKGKQIHDVNMGKNTDSKSKTGTEDPGDKNKHRTRLSTGSIYFDSELLRLSPTKIEKKIAEQEAKRDVSKEKIVKAATCKKLNLSPRKLGSHSAGKPKQAFYPLSTGLKQCPKCRKKFWKKKSYDFHMLHVCNEKTKARVGKKRMLSLSPRESVSERAKDGETKFVVVTKKAKLDSEENIPEKNITKENTTKITNYIRDSDKYTEKTSSQDKETDSHLKELSKPQKVSPKKAIDKQADDDSPIFGNRNKVKEGVSSEKSESALKGKETEGESKSSSHGTTVRTSPRKDGNKNLQASVTKSSNKQQGSANVVKSLAFEDDKMRKGSHSESKTAGENKDQEKNKIDNSGEAFSEIIPTAGPSGLNTARMSIDDADFSDDNCSEFSGFSEDDLRMTEEELSAHLDVSGRETSEHAVEFGEEELSDLGDLDLSSDDDLVAEEGKVKAETSPSGEETRKGRPTRKSAQNRFGHIEEIWVYKEPGKPIVEKLKSQTSNTREYVVDANNPSKLHCHNSKDIDRLIDEKNLKCKQCDTPCISMSNLRRHVITHLGWKRYKCRLCPYMCYDKSRYGRHCKMSHDVKLTSLNFSEYVQDLKKEATKIRSDKRVNTLHSTKNKQEENIYQKPKTTIVARANAASPKDIKVESSHSASAEKEENLLSKARMGLKNALKDK